MEENTCDVNTDIDMSSATIDVQRSVTIMSSNGAALDGRGTNGQLLYVRSSATVTLDGLVFKSGSSSGYGGCINAIQATLVVVSSSFQNCTASSGGGVYAILATLAFTSSSFDGCVASNEGGGIKVDDSTLEVVSSSFLSCTAKSSHVSYLASFL